jgi:hypothetical protein
MRDAATEAAYAAAIADYATVEDSVRIRVFGWRRVRDGDTLRAVRPAGGGWRRRALVPNAFPYGGLKTGEEHWVLWSEVPMGRGAVEAYLAREAPAWASRWRWWRNPPERQSVRGIWHVQVIFSRDASRTAARHS